MWRGKNGTAAPIIRWRADFLLSPAVGACYFKNTFENSISVHRNGKRHDSRRSTTIPNTKQKTSSFQKTPFLLLRHVIWPTAIHDRQWIQWSTKSWKQENKPWDEDGRVLFEKPKHIFFVICWTAWEVSNIMSFYLYRHWRVLFWPRLWPLLCQLCRQFPVPLP